MKYRITGINPKLTIKKYKIYNDKIKIKYLIGSKTISNNEENLNKIMDEMLIQAKEFVDSYRSHKTFDNTRIPIYPFYNYLGSNIIKLIFLIGQLNLSSKNYRTNILLLLAILTDLISKIYLINEVVLNRYVYKYELFLKNREDLELQHLFPYEIIDINNLDKKSLKYLKEQLQLIEMYKVVKTKML